MNSALFRTDLSCKNIFLRLFKMVTNQAECSRTEVCHQIFELQTICDVCRDPCLQPLQMSLPLQIWVKKAVDVVKTHCLLKKKFGQ